MTLRPSPFYVPAVLGPEQKTLAGISLCPPNFCTSDAAPTDPTMATLYPGSSIVEKEMGVGGVGGRTCVVS